MTTLTRIYANCTRKSNGCKLWNGTTNGGGYPYIYDKAHYCTGAKNNGMVAGRALVLKLAGEPVPTGQRVVMTCNERSCLAKEHMAVMTVGDAVRHAVKLGAYKTPRHTAASIANGRLKAKLNREKAEAIKAAVANGRSRQELADENNVDRSLIDQIVRGDRWKTLLAPNASIFTRAACFACLATGEDFGCVLHEA